jgi:hypothetical protein
MSRERAILVAAQIIADMAHDMATLYHDTMPDEVTPEALRLIEYAEAVLASIATDKRLADAPEAQHAVK